MVKFTGVIRGFDELGRIVIPPEVRKVLCNGEQDKFEILLDEENNQIILQKAKN